MYSVCQNYLFILFFKIWATSFGLTRPSSGQYLYHQKKSSSQINKTESITT